MSDATPRIGLLLTDDFLFISRVQGYARAAGFQVKSARTVGALFGLAADLKPSCVMLDVHVAGEKIGELVPTLKAIVPPPRVIGYGSHVAAEALQAARVAGCDLVVPNSRFVELLATDLPGWMSAESQ
jgi:ActR/RegA family two-component response regulator